MSQASHPPLEINVSRHFLGWLADEHIGLAFSTYQANRLFMLGLKPDGSLSTMERLYDRPMGLCASPGGSLYVGTRTLLWKLENLLPPGEDYNGYDHVYTPHLAHTTGDVDAHDIAVDASGQVVFVNTLFSCLATPDEHYHFKPLWKPPFISRLAPEDRCHLNGLAMEGGAPGYASAVARSDVPSGWRDRREAGGCLVHIPSGRVFGGGLSMPHSPRLHQGQLWLLNSGSGELGRYDLEHERFEPLAFCPGYLRGLAFHGNYAIAGLSRPRRERAFQGLAVDQRLEQKDAEARCGLCVVDLRNGNIVHWAYLEGAVQELYDVAVLPGVRRPMVLGFVSDEISRLVTYAGEDGPVFQALLDVDAPGPATQRPPAIPVIPQPPEPEKPAVDHGMGAQVTCQFAHGMEPAATAASLGRLTHPNLEDEIRLGRVEGSLAGVLARFDGQPVGLALAQYHPDRSDRTATLVSLFVEPARRRAGIAAALLEQLASGLAGLGCNRLDWFQRSDWAALPAVERLAAKPGWSRSQVILVQRRARPERLLENPQVGLATLPDGFEIFPWIDLTEMDRRAIQTGRKYPPEADPFRHENYREAACSLGLRRAGRVVGWLVALRGAPQVVQYDALYVSPDVKPAGRSGLACALVAEAARRQVRAGLPVCIWQTPATARDMLNFQSRYLDGYADTFSEVRRVSRRLGKAAGRELA